MKNLLFFALLALVAGTLSASNDFLPAGELVISPTDPVYELYDLQKVPAFPGGEAALRDYLAREIKSPDPTAKGYVVATFVVSADGRVTDIAIVKDAGKGTAEETRRVLQAMPRWTPGEKDGKAVAVRYTLPVKFVAVP